MKDYILNDKADYSYFQSLLEGIDGLFDREQQEIAWRGGDYSIYTSFDEIYMGFVNPCEYILTWDLPEDKRALLQKLYDMVDAYNEEYDEKEKTEKDVCDDPKWKEIIVFARQVYDDLKHVKYVPDKEDEEHDS